MVNPKYQIKITKNKEFHFVLIARNGRVVLSSETYLSKAGALRGIASVQNNCINRRQYIHKKSSNDKFYFVLIALNGEIVGVSQMYSQKSNYKYTIDSLIEIAQTNNIQDLTK